MPDSPTIKRMSTEEDFTLSTPDDDREQNSPLSPRRVGSLSSALNPRSCVTCRRRKVRCDKHNPCANCTKAGIECHFPPPGRAPRKSKKPADSELLARLRRLEGVVQTLGAQVDEDGTVTRTSKGQQVVQPNGRQNSPGSEPRRPSLEHDLGRLVINEGRSRYVSNAFWASMGDEISEMRDILDAPSSEDEDDYASPEQSGGSASSQNHQSFIFGYSSTMVNLKMLHPTASQIFILWEVFKENIDPLVRILHRPTAKNILINVSSNTDNISKAAESLLFAIYLGAVVSLTEVQCQSLLGEKKENLLNRYRFATEQALARAGFMNSSSLMTLQAFVLFLICVRHQDDTRFVWSLSGLAIHLARAQGIHRDGTNFDLGPFETEMRRRLWWHISILDTRSSEDHGTDPTFSEAYYDTKLPMNVDDDDLYPDMKEWPKPKVGCTEMTFCLLRFELSAATRRMNFLPPGPGKDDRNFLAKTLEEKEAMINETHALLENKYLKYCDMNIPIYWVSATVGRLILAKMWLMVHHPLSYRSYTSPSDVGPSPEIKERVFTTSVEVIEFSYLLEQNDSTAKWSWLFRTYMQWHAVAFVLSELCVRPPGPLYDRAWRAVESVYDDRVFNNPKNQRGMLWKPMRQLYYKTKTIRKQRAADRPPIEPLREATKQKQCEMTAPSDYSLGNPQFLSGNVVDVTAQALGLDFNFNDPVPVAGGEVVMATDMTSQLDASTLPSDPTDEHVNQWLWHEPLVQQNPEILWSGFSPNVGDFTVGPDTFNQYSSRGTLQEWH